MKTRHMVECSCLSYVLFYTVHESANSLIHTASTCDIQHSTLSICINIPSGPETKKNTEIK
jgi:hypothetical protein